MTGTPLRIPRPVLFMISILLLGALSTLAPSSAQAANGVPRPDHVVIVVFENTSESSIIGNPQAPYFNQLANTGANFTNAHAIEHPSQPNYLDLFSGSNQGVTDDSCPHTFSTANEGSQLLAAKLTFTGYSENLPAAGSTTCSSGNYARKHNPWANFTNIPAADNQPFTAFPTDFTHLPTVSWVVPNLCNDMHNCSIATGDTWLKAHLDAYAQWAKTHNSILITTFDENDGSGGNQIATIFNGQPVKTGNYSETISHFSVLRTIEDMYGLPHAGAAASATPITDIWATPTGAPPSAPRPVQPLPRHR
ncbi:alkaline phosphatase family protein [Streptomyces sp. NBC_01197]|uniref:alkaline phosphatase family protein n=1 Tax=Streptomyces sp. NBC_01197 TaxID=2903768 RepID=UPI002E16444F|nr:alkaline phosphatase family protein [Streptomyces sp. NBC_01197]